MNDEELDNLMRRVDPAQTVRDDRLEGEIQREIMLIVAPEPVTTRTRSKFVWPWVVVPALLATVVAVAVFVQLWNPLGTVQPAAATPPLLTLTPTSLGIGDVMDRAISQLTVSNQSEPERRSVSEGWYLQTEVGDAGTTSSVVSPQLIEVRWTAELSGSLTVTAGHSYVPGDGEIVVPADGAVPAPGDLIQQQEYGPGEMPVLFRNPPPVGVDEMRAYLAQTMGMDVDGDVLAYVDAVRVLLSEWTPSAAQMASILGVLRSFDEFEVAGDVMDRLGRPGVAIRVTSPTKPHFEYMFVLSRESGRIIALETIYLGGVAELDLPSPCVTDYVAWK